MVWSVSPLLCIQKRLIYRSFTWIYVHPASSDLRLCPNMACVIVHPTCRKAQGFKDADSHPRIFSTAASPGTQNRRNCAKARKKRSEIATLGTAIELRHRGSTFLAFFASGTNNSQELSFLKLAAVTCPTIVWEILPKPGEEVRQLFQRSPFILRMTRCCQESLQTQLPVLRSNPLTKILVGSFTSSTLHNPAKTALHVLGLRRLGICRRLAGTQPAQSIVTGDQEAARSPIL